VYAALTDPDALAVWLPPGGMTGRFEFFDLRPGGSYRMVLTYRDESSAAKTTADSDVVDVRFVDGGSDVSITAEDVPAGISAEDHAAGLASSLANLAAHLGA